MSNELPPLFYELFAELPRQGPGDFESTQKAFNLCREIPGRARILDLGCGSGASTFALARLTDGSILGVDVHPRLVERLTHVARERRQADRVKALVGDMNDLSIGGETFDLVWSEGALYNIGIRRALEVIRPLLRPRGYLAFTDAVWLSANPSSQTREAFAEYPAMGSVSDLLQLVRESRWEVIGHFTLPEHAWWDRFYAPMEERIETLRGKYSDEPAALTMLDELAREPAMHRKYGHEYGYEFVIARPI